MKEYNNGTKFNFIRTEGTALKESLNILNDVRYGKVEVQPEAIDWDKTIALYNKHCGANGDIDEFCSSHVTGYALVNDFSHDDTRKESLYLWLRKELYSKRMAGKIK